MTGEQFDSNFTNWENREPNNGENENYILYSGALDYKWNDGHDSSGYFICEWDSLEGDAVATTLTIENQSGGDFIKDISDATVKFILSADSSDVSVSIVDESNNIVYVQQFESCVKDDEYSFDWDGKDLNGKYVSEGIYKVLVKAGNAETVSDNITFYIESGFAGGDGSQTNPYLVSNLEEFKKVINRNTRYFKQTADIDAYYATVDAMGSDDVAFEGHYDGNGCKISSLIIKDGIFYQLGKGSIIENVDFEDCTVASSISNRIGVVAKLNYGNIQNCTFTNCASNAGGDDCRVGVICGVNYDDGGIMNCIMSNCGVSATGATSEAGGVCGLNHGKIINVSISDVNSSSDCNSYANTYAGGIAGYNAATGIISYCKTDGNVVSKNTSTSTLHFAHAGGIAGRNEGQVLYCTSSANVSASSFIRPYSGQIVGNNSGVVLE